FRLIGLSMQKAVDADRSITSLANAYRRFALAHPHLYRVMSSPASQKRRGTDEVVVAMKPFMEIFDFPVYDRRLNLQMRPIWAFLHGFVSIELGGQFLVREGVEEAFQRGVQIFEHATHSRPAVRQRGMQRTGDPEEARRLRDEKDWSVYPLEDRLTRAFYPDGPVPSVDLMDGLCRAFLSPVFARGRLLAGAHELVDTLRARGIPMAIVSNMPWGAP